MEPAVTVRIEGLAELQARLETLAPKTGRRIIYRGLRAGGQRLLDDMRARVRYTHFDSGFLYNHIIQSIRLDRGELAGSSRVGPSRANYPSHELKGKARKEHLRRKRATWSTTIRVSDVARFLEFGTRKMHAFPFMRAAFESSKAEALADFVAEARVAFEETTR